MGCSVLIRCNNYLLNSSFVPNSIIVSGQTRLSTLHLAVDKGIKYRLCVWLDISQDCHRWCTGALVMVMPAHIYLVNDAMTAAFLKYEG